MGLLALAWPDMRDNNPTEPTEWLKLILWPSGRCWVDRIYHVFLSFKFSQIMFGDQTGAGQLHVNMSGADTGYVNLNGTTVSTPPPPPPPH